MAAGTRTARLLERERELAALDDALARVRAGTGATVVIEGAAGIGKTRLLREAAARAATGTTVLRATGSALERELPYGCVVGLVGPALATLPADRRAAVPGAARALLDGGEPPAGLNPTLPLLHGLHAVCAQLATDRPLLVVLDDAHEADAPSLRFLAYLAARLEELPIGVLVAVRGGAEPTDAAALDAVRSGAEILRPCALSPAGVAEQVRDRHPEATNAFCAGCARVTTGNPLYLTALLSALDDDRIAADDAGAQRLERLGVETVARAVLGRIAALGPDAAALAGAVAILGDDVPLRTAVALAGIDREEAPAAADRLAAADVLHAGPTLTFVHPIVREAVYDDLGPARRARDHLRAAQLMSDAGADAVAAHLLRAEPAGEPWAVEALRAAAAAARRRGAPDLAVRCLRRALDEEPAREERAAVLRELGAAEALIHEPEAVAVLQEAWTLADRPAERSRVALELGRALIMQGRLAECVEVCDRAGADPEADPELLHRLQTELIGAARLDLSTRELCLKRMALVDPQTTDRLLLANLAYEHALAGEPAAAGAALALRALDDGALLAAETSDAPVLYLATNALTLCERFDAAEAAFAEVVAEAHARGSALGFAIASCFRADAANRRGDPRAGLAHAEAAIAASEAHGWALGLPMAIGVAVDALVELGELATAQATLERAPLTAGELPDNVFFTPVLFSRGRLRIARGDLREGLEDVLEVGRRQDAWRCPNPSVLPWRSTAAEALVVLGDRERARALAAEELALAARFGAPRALTMARRAAALTADPGEAIEQLAAAVAAVPATDAPIERARCQVDLGAALRRSGQRRAARDELRAALDAAVATGALALAARAEAELLATGARPRRVRLSGADALTPSERRVAEMAARGLSNPEIAQRLFVTRRTVETHLTSAYRKLGVRTREELGPHLTSAADG